MELLRLGSDRFFGIYYPLLITLVIGVSIYYQLYEYQFAFPVSYLTAAYIVLSPITFIFLLFFSREHFWDGIIEPFLNRHGMPEFVMAQSVKVGDPHIDGSDKQYVVSNGKYYLLLPRGIEWNSPEAKEILDDSSSSLKKEYEQAHYLKEQTFFLIVLSYFYLGARTPEQLNVVEFYLKDRVGKRIAPKDLEYLSSCLQEGGNTNPEETVKQFLRLTELNFIQRNIVTFIDIFFLYLGITVLCSLILSIIFGIAFTIFT